MSKELVKQKMNSQVARNKLLNECIYHKRITNKTKCEVQDEKYAPMNTQNLISDIMMKFESSIPECFVQVDLLPDIPKKLSEEIKPCIHNTDIRQRDRIDHSQFNDKRLNKFTSENFRKESKDKSDSNHQKPFKKRDYKYISKCNEESDIFHRHPSHSSWCVSKFPQIKNSRSPIKCFYEVPKAPRNTTRYIIEERKLDKLILPPKTTVRQNSVSTIKSCRNVTICKSHLQTMQRKCRLDLNSEPIQQRKNEKYCKVNTFTCNKRREKTDMMRDKLNESMFNCIKPKAQFITEFDENNDDLFYGSISQHDCLKEINEGKSKKKRYMKLKSDKRDPNYNTDAKPINHNTII